MVIMLLLLFRVVATWWLLLRSVPAQSSSSPSSPPGRRRVMPAASFLPRIRNNVPGAPVGGTSSARAMALEGQQQVQRHQTGGDLHPRLTDICTIVDHAQMATLVYYSIHEIIKILSKTKHNIRVTQRKMSDVGASYCIIQYTNEREDSQTHRIISVAGSRNTKNWNQNIDTNLETDEFLKRSGLLDKAHRGYLTVYRAVLADFLAEEQRTAALVAGMAAVAVGGAPAAVDAANAAANAANAADGDSITSSNGSSNSNSNGSSNSNGDNGAASIATAASAVAAALAPAVTSYTATSSRNVSAVPPALSKTICVTGHSLGGAVSCLLALGLKGHGYDVDQVTIFGTPKFTDKRGAEQIAQSKLRISRFEHVWDPAVFSPVAMPQPEKIVMGMTVGRNVFGGLAGAAMGSLAGIAMTDVYSDLDKNTLILLEPLSSTNAWVPPSDGGSNSTNNEQAPPIAFVGGALSLLVGSGAADGDGVTRGPHRVVAGKDAASRASMVARLRDLPGVDWRWHSMHAYHDLLKQYRDRYFLQQYYRQQTAKPATAANVAPDTAAATPVDAVASTPVNNTHRQR